MMQATMNNKVVIQERSLRENGELRTLTDHQTSGKCWNFGTVHLITECSEKEQTIRQNKSCFAKQRSCFTNLVELIWYVNSVDQGH